MVIDVKNRMAITVHDLNETQMRLLMLISDGEDHTYKEVADFLKIEKSSIYGIIYSLENKGIKVMRYGMNLITLNPDQKIWIR